jgi:5-methylcytosine-specific restriction endonuclease McrA
VGRAGWRHRKDGGLFEQVLLLNASFEPLNVINWRRAVKLVFMEKVEVVEESERVIRSISSSMRIPSVVRLVQFVRFRRREARFSRRNVYARDHYKCQYCGSRFSSEELTCDHVVPRSQGGRAEWSNIVTCCVACNRRKGGRTPEQAGLHLLKAPARPTWLWGFHTRIGGGAPPPGWQSYLRLQTEH